MKPATNLPRLPGAFLERNSITKPSLAIFLLGRMHVSCSLRMEAKRAHGDHFHSAADEVADRAGQRMWTAWLAAHNSTHLVDVIHVVGGHVAAEFLDSQLATFRVHAVALP